MRLCQSRWYCIEHNLAMSQTDDSVSIAFSEIDLM